MSIAILINTYAFIFTYTYIILYLHCFAYYSCCHDYLLNSPLLNIHYIRVLNQIKLAERNEQWVTAFTWRTKYTVNNYRSFENGLTRNFDKFESYREKTPDARRLCYQYKKRVKEKRWYPKKRKNKKGNRMRKKWEKEQKYFREKEEHKGNINI